LLVDHKPIVVKHKTSHIHLKVGPVSYFLAKGYGMRAQRPQFSGGGCRIFKHIVQCIKRQTESGKQTRLRENLSANSGPKFFKIHTLFTNRSAYVADYRGPPAIVSSYLLCVR